MTKRTILLLGGVVAGILALAIASWWLWVGYKTSPKSWPTEHFSSVTWKASAREQRYVFYRDLAESGLLDEATKQEVVELLGPPDYEDPQGASMSYTLKYGGADEPLFNFLYFLHIELRPNGRVQRYGVRTD